MTARYQLLPVGVLDTQLGQTITPASGQAWADYLAWVQVNTPDPMPVAAAPAPTAAELAALAELAARDATTAALRSVPQLQALKGMTDAQVSAWFDANVTNLAGALSVLKIITRLVALLVRERL